MVWNRPPMLEKSMYDSWASPQQLQDDFDVQATNIILHGLPPYVYALVNHQEVAKDIWDRGETLYEYYWRFSQLINDMHTIGMTMQQVQVNTKFLNALPSEWSKFVTDVKLAKMTQQSQAEFPQLDSSLAVPMFQQGEDPIECINKAMAFLQPFKMEESQFNKFKEGKLRVLLALEIEELLQPQGETMQLVKQRPKYSSWFNEEQLAFIADPRIVETQVAQQTIPQNSAFQTEDLDAYDSDYDAISLAKAVLMANLSICDSNVLSEVPYSDTYLNDIINQDVQEMLYSEQIHIVDFPDNKITSDSNIIPYSQYL
ncbi:hypothetical protein Tco_0059069 [Tanacetum coccineum]